MCTVSSLNELISSAVTGAVSDEAVSSNCPICNDLVKHTEIVHHMEIHVAEAEKLTADHK